MRKSPVQMWMTLFLLLGACVSQPVADPKNTGFRPVESANRSRIVAARVQIQNKVETKTYTLGLEAMAIEPSRMRLDLTGPFGTSVGKMVWSDQKVTILSPQQKKAYQGEASEDSFRPLFGMQIHPRDLMAFLLGDLPRGWTCVTEDQLQTCHDSEGKLTLERQAGDEKAKWVVNGERFSLTVLPQVIRTNVQAKSELFTLSIPEGYSKHKLP